MRQGKKPSILTTFMLKFVKRKKTENKKDETVSDEADAEEDDVFEQEVEHTKPGRHRWPLDGFDFRARASFRALLLRERLGSWRDEAGGSAGVQGFLGQLYISPAARQRLCSSTSSLSSPDCRQNSSSCGSTSQEFTDFK